MPNLNDNRSSFLSSLGQGATSPFSFKKKTNKPSPQKQFTSGLLDRAKTSPFQITQGVTQQRPSVPTPVTSGPQQNINSFRPVQGPVRGETRDNQITNRMVLEGRLPQSRREIFPQRQPTPLPQQPAPFQQSKDNFFGSVARSTQEQRRQKDEDEFRASQLKGQQDKARDGAGSARERLDERTLQRDEDLQAARQNVTDLRQRTAEELLRTRNEEDRIRDNEAGALAEGVDSQISKEARASARTLADLALAEGVSVDILNSLIDQGEGEVQAQLKIEDFVTSMVENGATQEQVNEALAGGTLAGAQSIAAQSGLFLADEEGAEGFTLSEGQSRFDAQGNRIAFGGAKTFAPKSGGGSGGGSGEQPVSPGGFGGSTRVPTDSFGNRIKLTAGQTDAVTGFNDLLDSLPGLTTLVEGTDFVGGVETGPLQNIKLELAKLSGIGIDEDALSLEQKLEKIKADFFKAISGVAVGAEEVKRLSKFLPTFSDQEKVILSKITNLTEEMRKKKKNMFEAVGAVSPEQAPHGSFTTSGGNSVTITGV